MNKDMNSFHIESTSIIIGNRKVTCDISFCERKHLTINVHPDMTMSVRAPIGGSIDSVLERVKKRTAWIIRQLHYFEKFQPLPTERKYISGETHLYLGRQYRMKLVADKEESVKLKGRFLWVRSPLIKNKKRVKSLVDGWYRNHAIPFLSKRLAVLMETAGKLRIPDPIVSFRKMSKRWGSCAKSGTIILNTELVKAPVHCIDYVIAHELCHLRYKNHSPAFWRLMSRLMPDWEKRKLRLEEVLI
jgi:predicted metal-dependent hydrolase